jgi:predicted nucleic acid-binding protein
MAVLIDTSVLVAYAFRRDRHHNEARQVILSTQDEPQIVPAPVLTELFYLITVRLDYSKAVQAFSAAHRAFTVESLAPVDLARMEAIMKDYADARFDYTDVAIMTLSERLNVTQLCTFDRRDFGIFRPSHCKYLQLLPE